MRLDYGLLGYLRGQNRQNQGREGAGEQTLVHTKEFDASLRSEMDFLGPQASPFSSPGLSFAICAIHSVISLDRRLKPSDP